jgi:hypothetical protein
VMMMMMRMRRRRRRWTVMIISGADPGFQVREGHT